jgi:hypothetical protein
MKKSSFHSLIDWLLRENLLKSSKNFAIEEKVAMFLITATYGPSNKAIQELFQHSGKTVNWLVNLLYNK